MDTALFDYPFPKELVAQHPLPDRDASKMMVLCRETGHWKHRTFSEITEYLKPGDLLVVNNAHADPIEVEGRKVPPLPPYIKRKTGEDFAEEDFRRYRTVYASVPGSKAAPTAGFHFSGELLRKIREKRVELRELTLHLGFDTYKPIRTETIETHPMHGEEYEIPEETAEAVMRAKREDRRVIAVGTTVVRALESFGTGGATAPEEALGAARNSKPEGDASGESTGDRPPAIEAAGSPVSKELARPTCRKTRLFIFPGFQFKIVDALLTNFHRPRSTVLVMVSAFAGRDLILAAYEEAIRERYRLFSYGDCMLII